MPLGGSAPGRARYIRETYEKPHAPPSAGGRASPARRPALPAATMTRSASTRAPSTTTPVMRTPSMTRRSAWPERSSSRRSLAALDQRTRSKTERRQASPVASSGKPSGRAATPPAEIRASQTSGSDSSSARRTIERKKCGWGNCMTPRRAQGPLIGGPGSRSTTVTSSPRLASAIALKIPTGPPPTTTTRIPITSRVLAWRYGDTVSHLNAWMVTSMSTPVKRPYSSTLRAAQARATRRAIVDAAARLFIELGYGATTVDAIAEAAGVSRKTVFTSVGGKADALKLAIDWAVTGDDEP